MSGKGWGADGVLAHCPSAPPQRSCPRPARFGQGAKTKGGGCRFASVPSPRAPRLWSNPPGVPCPRPFPQRQGRTGRAHGPESRSAKQELESTRQRGPQLPGWLISPSRPWGWHLGPFLRQEDAAGTDARARAAERVPARSAEQRSGDCRAALAPPLPPRDSWIGCWCGLSLATPFFSTRSSRPAPFAELSGLLWGFSSPPPVITNGFKMMIIMKTVY